MTPAQKLYEDLRTEILERKLLPGMLLPSENELCEKYSISRPTVRRVQEKLCAQNLIEKRPGVGTFVKDMDGGSSAAEMPEFRIGVDFLMEMGAHYYGRLMQGVHRSLYGKNCMFCSLYGEYLAPANIPPQLDALLLMKAGDHDREDFKRAVSCGKPALLINRLPVEPELAYLSVDHRKESELAVTYLLRSGCRDIVLAGNREDERTVALRSRGWEDAYRNAGLEVPYHLTVNAEDLLSCQEKVKEFIRTRSFSAVFFTNMAMMRAFYQAFLQCRSERMDTLSLMCFDDLDHISEFNDLVCSFVRMPLERMGEMAIEYLRKKKADPYLPVLRRLMPCSMVIRHRPEG